jgi:hypothetical protein
MREKVDKTLVGATWQSYAQHICLPTYPTLITKSKHTKHYYTYTKYYALVQADTDSFNIII